MTEVSLNKNDYDFIEKFMVYRKIEKGYGHSVMLEDFLNLYKLQNNIR